MVVKYALDESPEGTISEFGAVVDVALQVPDCESVADVLKVVGNIQRQVSYVNSNFWYILSGNKTRYTRNSFIRFVRIHFHPKAIECFGDEQRRRLVGNGRDRCGIVV